MKDYRETIRFNINNPKEAKMVRYLDAVKGKRKGAFIKEAMEMYIEAIEQGFYECPFLVEEQDDKDKFKNVLKQQSIAQYQNEIEVRKEISEETETFINSIFEEADNKMKQIKSNSILSCLDDEELNDEDFIFQRK